MKKLMIIAAAVCVAALTQAASINWGVANFTITLAGGANSGAALNGLDVYLIDAAAAGDIATAIEAGTFSGATTGVLGVRATTSTKGLIAQGTTTSDALIRGDTYGFAILVFDTFEGTDYYAISSSLSQSAYLVGTDEPASISFSSVQFNAGTGWEVVPEPTSMALLALGVAAIGLRRKLRK